MGAAVSCPICNNSMVAIEDWLWRCPSCRFLKSNLQPGGGSAFNSVEGLRRANFEILIDLLERFRPISGAKILEVGAGKGWFLEAAKKRGAIVKGVEPETDDIAIAKAAGLDVEHGFYPDLPSDRGPYDFVIFNDVFEHLPDPTGALLATEQLLAPGGLLVVNIPNSAGTLYRIACMLRRVGMRGPFDRLWQKSLPSPHLSYFSRENLRHFVESKTTMKECAATSLPAFSRDGVKYRVDSMPVGGPKWLTVGALTGLSYVMPVLPNDIHVGLYQKV